MLYLIDYIIAEIILFHRYLITKEDFPWLNRISVGDN